MDIFLLVLSQMLMMALLIAVGFLLSKKKLISENSGSVISKLETFIFVPALSLYNQLNNCTVDNFKQNSRLILYGLLFVLMAIAIAYPLSRLFVRRTNGDGVLEYQRNIYKYALTFGNFGFMGNFIILGLFGDAMLYKYTMFTFFVSFLCYSWGLYVLIPKGESSLLKNLKKGLLTPPIIALLIGIVCGLLNVRPYVPDFAMSALENASKCMGPAAMVLAGIVIGGYDVKELMLNKKVYLVSLLRLIVIPSVMMLLLKAIGMDKETMMLVLIAFATPLGMNTIVYPAAYGGDTKTGASMTMISHVLSIITIPVMYYIFIELL